jgi:hypothetical protein
MCCLPPFSCSRISQPDPFDWRILDAHLERRADAGEAVGEGADQRPIAEIPYRVGRDAVDPSPPLLALQLRRRAGLDDMLGATHPRGLIEGATWPTISQSNSIRTAASYCFTPGAEWVCWSVSI